jgi:hypothetical protein
MAARISNALIEASNAARIAFIRTVDPGFSSAPAKPTGGAPPPPPSGGGAKPLLPNYYTDAEYFFRSLGLKYPDGKLMKGSGKAVNGWEYADWVNYFFTEVRGVGVNETDMGRVCALLFGLENMVTVDNRRLTPRAGFSFPAPAATSFYSLLAVEPAGIPLDIMDYLLNTGFKYENTVSAAAAKIPGTEDMHGRFGPFFDLKSATNQDAAQKMTKDHFLLYYRGDGREPSVVIAQGGASCRADLSFWRKEAQVDASWHPWSKVTERSKMWLRNGNKDNDYFTVNSITMDFHISCAYPILRLKEFGPAGLFKGHITDWSHEERARLRQTKRADFCTMRHVASGREEFVLSDRIRVYVCVFEDSTELSPTYKAGGGNTYAEAGVRNVPLEQILAYFEMERYHVCDSLRATQSGGQRSQAYYESSGAAAGHSMMVVPKKWSWLSPSKGQNLLGIERPQLLAQKFDSLINRPFEINHDRLISSTNTSYSYASLLRPANVWGNVQAPARVRI